MLAQCAADSMDSPVHRVIVCTKAQDAQPAVADVAETLADDAAVLLMHNGMGPQEAIARAYPHLSVYAASSTEGAYRPAPDTVVHAGRGVTRIGRLGGAAFDWTSIFRSAGLEAETAEPIEWYLAGKLRVNALINPLTVLYDCPNGQLLDSAEALEWMRRLGEEADRVLAAAGFEFADTAFDAAVAVAHATAANHSSMLQDARAGRVLELEPITGYLLKLARDHRLTAPAHEQVHERLRNAR